MSAAPFSPEQEVRLREIVREEEAATGGLGLTSCAEGFEAILPLQRVGLGVTFTPRSKGSPRKFKGVLPSPSSDQQGVE